MNFITEHGKLLTLYVGFDTLADEAYKAMKTAEANEDISQEEMDALYDKCDKALDAKCTISNALETIRKVLEMKATLAQMELQAQELTNRAYELATAYLDGQGRTDK